MSLRPDNEKAVSSYDSVPDMEPCPIEHCDGGVIDLVIEHGRAQCARCGLSAPGAEVGEMTPGKGKIFSKEEDRYRRAAENWNELVTAIQKHND